MNVKFNTIILILIASFNYSNAQKEWNIWYFGAGAGLDFNTNPPTVLDGGQITTKEGCASISDPATGQILFYSDGTTVWNRNHQVMLNGANLKGHYSSAQSAVIVPRPGWPNRYYLFTADFIGSAQGYYYNEIDMSLDGGNGGIIPSQKNIFLYGPNTEKIAAIKHCNGVDYWIVTHKMNSDAFYVYLVTQSGISPPAIQHVGSYVSGGSGSWQGAGNIVGSQDSKLVLHQIGPYPMGQNSKTEIFDFDNTTGTLTLKYTIQAIPGAGRAAFSPSGKFVYVSTAQTQDHALYQFDLQAGTNQDINNSKYKVYDCAPNNFGDIQITPYGDMYVAIYKSFAGPYPYLSVIHNPDMPKAACNFEFHGIDLAPNQSINGLPNFIANVNYTPPLGYYSDTLCTGQSVVINNNIYDTSHPNGIEYLPLQASSGCDSIVVVNIHFTSTITSYYTQTLCSGQSVSINGQTYDQNNPEGNVILPNAAQGGCDSSIIVQLNFLPPVQAYYTPTLCPGQSVTINGTTFDQNNPEGIVILPNAAQGGCDSIVHVQLSFSPVITENYQVPACIGDTLFVGATSFQYDHPSGSVLLPGGAMGGCDSVVNVNLIFYDDTAKVKQTLCWSDTVVVGDSVFSLTHPAGMVTLTGAAHTGCDSIVDVELVFQLPDTTLVRDTICWYDSVRVNGHLYVMGHNEGLEFIPTPDCDSVVVVRLFSPYDVMPSLDFVTKDSICYGETVRLTAVSSLIDPVYIWYKNDSIFCDSCDEAFARIIRGDRIGLTGIDRYGCTLTTGRQLEVLMDYGVYIPNVFSPNVDGFNDKFTLYANKKGVELVLLRIFDRWGNLVYETAHHDVHAFQHEGWDGTFHGKKMDPGVFVYVAVVRFVDGQTRMFSGDVTLVR